MAMTMTAKEKELRERYLALLTSALADEECLAVSANEIAIPCLDAEGNESCVIVKVSTPRGSRNGDGSYTPYDPYAAAEDYKLDVAEKLEKKKATEAKKAAKIAADKAKREAKAAKEEE